MYFGQFLVIFSKKFWGTRGEDVVIDFFGGLRILKTFFSKNLIFLLQIVLLSKMISKCISTLWSCSEYDHDIYFGNFSDFFGDIPRGRFSRICLRVATVIDYPSPREGGGSSTPKSNRGRAPKKLRFFESFYMTSVGNPVRVHIKTPQKIVKWECFLPPPLKRNLFENRPFNVFNGHDIFF